MDLLKEVQKLISKKHKARDNLNRKRKYFLGAQTSFRKARREFKMAAKVLHSFRKEHKFELADLRTDPADPVVINTPSVKPTPIAESESVEENTD